MDDIVLGHLLPSSRYSFPSYIHLRLRLRLMNERSEYRNEEKE